MINESGTIPRRKRVKVSKSDRFISTAKKRTTVAIKAIRRVGGLSVFSPSEDQIDDILSSLTAEIARTSNTLKNTVSLPPVEFTFSKAA